MKECGVSRDTSWWWWWWYRLLLLTFFSPPKGSIMGCSIARDVVSLFRRKCPLLYQCFSRRCIYIYNVLCALWLIIDSPFLCVCTLPPSSSRGNRPLWSGFDYIVYARPKTKEKKKEEVCLMLMMLFLFFFFSFWKQGNLAVLNLMKHLR